MLDKKYLVRKQKSLLLQSKRLNYSMDKIINQLTTYIINKRL